MPTPPHRLPRSDASDSSPGLVIKVKYSGNVKRFNACVGGPHFDLKMSSLRSKIASAFNFSRDADFTLTYTDEDGDVVMLDDDNDLRDAAFNQKLNPLRINLQLKGSSAGAPQTKQQALNSRSPVSAALEDQLAQVKSAIDEALKFVPEKVPIVLAKLSDDLRSKAASAPSLAELLDRLAKLMTSKSNMQYSNGPASGPPGSSSDELQTLGNLNDETESEFMIISSSLPSDKQNSESSKALGPKSVLVDNAKAQVEQASGYRLVEDPLVSASSGGKKVVSKDSFDAQRKGKAQAKCKSAKSSTVTPVATMSDAIPTLHPAPAPAPSVGENVLRYELPFFMSNYRKMNRDLHSIFPPPPTVPPNCWTLPLGANGNTNGALPSAFPPPPTYSYNPFKLNMPSSVGPYQEGVHSFGGSCRDVSNKYDGKPQHALNRWIQCDGCGVTLIVGPCYKSNVANKDNYDLLCSACFSHMGNEAEYTRIDRPSLVSQSLISTDKNRRIISKLQQDSHDCRFIRDVTVPDGTIMAPSTPFTKIWRMHNNGSIMWPFGTHLIWTGGYQFAACQRSVKLGISVDGFPVNQEIDVGLDFIAPVKPGRYISYWALALPSGQKFGQGVWVDIQVEQPVQTSGNKKQAAINLNLPPEGNSTKWKPFIDMNVEPVNLYEYNGSTSTDWPLNLSFPEAIKPNVSQPVHTVLPSSPTAVEPLQIPITDSQVSSTGSLSTLASAGVPAAPETIPLPKPFSVPAHTSVGAPVPPVPASMPEPAPMHASASVSLPSVPPPDKKKLMRELFEMGFTQLDLNRAILRKNNYDLEQSVDDLCHFHDWSPLEQLSGGFW